MKKLISLMLVALVVLCLCACAAEPSLVGTTPVNDTPTVSLPKTFKLGDSVELNGVVVSFLDVTESTGAQFMKPAEGKVYLLCEFEISNNSTQELSVSSMLSFEAYCDDYACDYSIGALSAKGDKEQLDGSVAAGKKMKGVVGYEVPADWQELEIQYTLDIMDDDKITFIATNS